MSENTDHAEALLVALRRRDPENGAVSAIVARIALDHAEALIAERDAWRERCERARRFIKSKIVRLGGIGIDILDALADEPSEESK